MRQGQIKKLKIDDDIFLVEAIEKVPKDDDKSLEDKYTKKDDDLEKDVLNELEEIQKMISSKPKKSKKDKSNNKLEEALDLDFEISPKNRGKVLDTISHCSIRENVVKAIQRGKQLDLPKSKLVKIIGKFHPKAKKDSCITYLNRYNDFLQGKGSNDQKFLDKKEKDGIIYNKHYQIWIEKDEIDKVKNAIFELNSPTSENISSYTGFDIQKTRGILYTMKKLGKVNQKRLSGQYGGRIVYNLS